MILTENAKLDFFIYLYEKYPISNTEKEKWFKSMYESFKNALIVEWFLHIKIWENVFYNEYRNTGFKYYELSIKQSIIKCNKIYNESKKM